MGGSGGSGNQLSGGRTSNIVWLHTDVSSWNITSQISNVEIKEDGQVCIHHSKSGEWEAKSIADPNSDTDPSTSDSVEGHAWIMVPIRDSYYAAIYDYMIAGDPCHALDTGSIANLYNSDKSLGKRTDKEPLKSWEARGGDTIYFMVSGLTIDNRSNVQERSNLIKITLPSEDGEDPTIVHQSCEDDPTGPYCPGQCNVPNRAGIVRQIARDDSDSLQQGHQLNLNRVGNGAQSADDARWKFMDTVAETLNETESRWGYICAGGDCEDISTDTLGYLCNDSDTGTTPVDIIDNTDGSVQWSIKSAGDDTWKFPRVEEEEEEDEEEDNNITVDNDVSDFSWDKVRWLNSHNVSCWPEASNITSVDVRQSGQICIDHTKKGQWPPIPTSQIFSNGGPDPTEGNPYIIVKIDGVYYAATYEWLRPGQVCKLGFAGPLSITYASEDSLGKHTKRHPLQDWEPQGGRGYRIYGVRPCQIASHSKRCRKKSDCMV